MPFALASIDLQAIHKLLQNQAQDIIYLNNEQLERSDLFEIVHFSLTNLCFYEKHTKTPFN